MALQVEAQNVRSRRAIELQLHLGLGLEDGDVAEIARQPRATAAPCPRRLGAGQLPLLYSLAGTRRESVLHFSPIGWVAHQISPGCDAPTMRDAKLGVYSCASGSEPDTEEGDRATQRL